MPPNHSIQFFDTQFVKQAIGGEYALNPFELAALPYLKGKVLDFGCGMGNLAMAAAERGCDVLALDGSPAAIENIQKRVLASGLSIRSALADLRAYPFDEDFDVISCIGLLPYFDCLTSHKVLANLQAKVRPGGIAIVNVLIQGTNYLDMFDPVDHCLFNPTELPSCFANWELISSEFTEFESPRMTKKVFSTVIARKPAVGSATG